jgi:hypothetical protein
MYSTCLFCNSELGRNEALEAFPVGRRLAFDARKGRLWVVCRKCERWNLTPLEERWEAIEQAERLFRETKKRVSTENIGLSRLPDETELVRIGEPLRPEYAAWRYGDQFGRRRQRQMWVAGGGLGVFGLAVAGNAAAGMVGGLSAVLMSEALGLVHGNPQEVVARARLSELGTVAVRRKHLAETRLVSGSDAPLALDLCFTTGEARIEGSEALRITGLLMPHVNRYGGDRDTVQSAVARLDAVGGTDGFLDKLGTYASDATAVPLSPWTDKRKLKRSWTGAFTTGLFGLSAPDRLALEMALHEEAELRALRGELSELEAAWREAEEIAAIADNLVTPSPIQKTLEKLRRITSRD